MQLPLGERKLENCQQQTEHGCSTNYRKIKVCAVRRDKNQRELHSTEHNEESTGAQRETSRKNTTVIEISCYVRQSQQVVG